MKVRPMWFNSITINSSRRLSAQLFYFAALYVSWLECATNWNITFCYSGRCCICAQPNVAHSYGHTCGIKFTFTFSLWSVALNLITILTAINAQCSTIDTAWENGMRWAHGQRHVYAITRKWHTRSTNIWQHSVVHQTCGNEWSEGVGAEFTNAGARNADPVWLWLHN